MSKFKPLLIALCAILAVSLTVVGTLAYITAQDTVTNTFTVGKVALVLDEAKVNTSGQPIDASGSPVNSVADAPRVKGNEYHLLPGATYTKDPTVTVKAGSDAAYVRMLVSINKLSALDAIFDDAAADLLSLFNGKDASKWILAGSSQSGDVITYEFRYFEVVDASASSTNVALEPLFESITLPGFITGEQLSTLYVSQSDCLNINVVAHAIQSTGFATEAQAWAAFDAQYPQATPTN